MFIWLILVRLTFVLTTAVAGDLGHGSPNSASAPLYDRTVHGDYRAERGLVAKAIGKGGQCSGTLVSPPGEPAVVLRAGHCPRMFNFRVAGKIISGFSCYSNRDWAATHSANDDTGICFSPNVADTGYYGCLDPQPNTKIAVNESLRTFGYGNPVRGQPMIDTLLSGKTKVQWIQNGKAIVAQDTAGVTPGDSGGPVARESEITAANPKYFKIVGINSKYMGTHGSVFAPLTKEALGFFDRALARYASENPGRAKPRVCGHNWKPEDPSRTPVPLPPPSPAPSSSPSPLPSTSNLGEHLALVGGEIHEKVGNGTEKIFGSPDGIPFGENKRPMSEAAQEELVLYFCLKGLADHYDARLINVLAFMAKHAKTISDRCKQKILRPALGRADKGNSLVDSLRVSLDAPTPSGSPTATPTSQFTPTSTPTHTLPPAKPEPGAAADASAAYDAVRPRCVGCHGLPEFTKNWATWEALLQKGDPEAKHWLGRFDDKVVRGTMLDNLKLPEAEQKPLKAWLSRMHDKYLGGSRPTSDRVGSPEASLMIPAARKDEYFAVLKKAAEKAPSLKTALLEFDAIWDKDESPAWSWAAHAGDAGRRGQRPVDLEPSAPAAPELFQRIDGKWAWKEPFHHGFSRDAKTTGLKSFFLVRFPRDASGRIIKGIRGKESYNSILSHTGHDGHATSGGLGPGGELPELWANFPDGTRVLEVQYSTTLGEPVVVDVLTREKRVAKDGASAEWIADAHRPDASPERIRAWLDQQADAKTNPDLLKIRDAVNNPVADEVRSDLGAAGTGGVPFIVDGKETGSIPGSKSVVPEGVTRETLLKMYRELPLASAAGSKGWQLEPQGVFKGAHRGIRIDSKTCVNCHKMAGEKFTNVFIASKLDTTGVSAYGSVGGYDGILSAPWFDKAALAQYGRREIMEMRPEWGKFFEDYDASKHPARTYRRSTRWGRGDRDLISPR